MKKFLFNIIGLATTLITLANPSFAQSDAAEQSLTADDKIVVTGTSRKNSVIGGLDPEFSLDSGSINAYGASSVAELVEELAPQLESGRGRGRPIVLIDGRRASGFRELRNYPPEALARVDVLSEEGRAHLWLSPRSARDQLCFEGSLSRLHG